MESNIFVLADRTTQSIKASVVTAGSFGAQIVRVVDVDGSNVQGLYAKKITVSGDDTYVGSAAIGASQASAVWRAKKIAVSGDDTVITWADGDSLFDNSATDLTALSYS